MPNSWQDYQHHNTWCQRNQAMPGDYHKKSLCQCSCHFREQAANFIEGEVAFEDLPQEDRSPRAVLAEGMPCLPSQRHTFAPFETFCLCGVLERGSGTLAEAFLIWPVAEARG